MPPTPIFLSDSAKLLNHEPILVGVMMITAMSNATLTSEIPLADHQLPLLPRRDS